MNPEKKLLQDVSAIAQRLKELHNDAVIAYTPLVHDLCAKRSTKNEVGWMLDLLFGFAGDERKLRLYKQVCRAYWKIYPETIAFYIMEYRKEYDRESLIGTEYEYLLHEDEMNEDNPQPPTDEREKTERRTKSHAKTCKNDKIKNNT